MTKIISICNQKGGVGKTTTSVNTAAGIAAMEKKVLLIDMDPQGNASQGLGFSTKIEKDVYWGLCQDPSQISQDQIQEMLLKTDLSFLRVLPSNQDLAGLETELQNIPGKEKRLSKLISRFKAQFDYILIDSPPSLNLLTLNVLAASQSVLIPIQCEYYALMGLAELTKVIHLVKKHLNPSLQIEGVLLTMFDSRLNLAKQVMEDVNESFKGKVFETVIPRSVKLSEAPSFGKPILLYDIASAGALKYLELAKELVENE